MEGISILTSQIYLIKIVVSVVPKHSGEMIYKAKHVLISMLTTKVSVF